MSQKYSNFFTVDDETHMEEAIIEARKSKSEGGDKPRPLVGVVLVLNDGRVFNSFRGRTGDGDHAEYGLIDKDENLEKVDLSNAIVYTTLEPCTKRKHPKISCAQRLIDCKVKKVFIGQLDPNPEICGKGVLMLRRAGINVIFFPPELMAKVESMNRKFSRDYMFDNLVLEHDPKDKNILPNVRSSTLALSKQYPLKNSEFWSIKFSWEWLQDAHGNFQLDLDQISYICPKCFKKPTIRSDNKIISINSSLYLACKCGFNSKSFTTISKFELLKINQKDLEKQLFKYLEEEIIALCLQKNYKIISLFN